MSLAKFIIKFNEVIGNKRARLFISILAIGHGVIRISNSTFTPVSFGNDIIFGSLLITLGVLLAITSISYLRIGILGHIVAAMLSGLYALLGTAIIYENISSSYTSFVIAIVLLIEELFIYEH